MWRRQRGLTLVELMVSMVLALVLMVGTMEIFKNSKATYKTTDALGYLQENARFALKIMEKDIRQAGYTGCVGATTHTNVIDIGDDSGGDFDQDWYWMLDYRKPIRGYDGSDNTGFDTYEKGYLDNFSSGDTLEDTDVFSVMYGVRGAGYRVKKHLSDPGTARLVVYRDSTIPKGTPMIVTDCAHTALFQKSNGGTGHKRVVHKTSGDATPGNCGINLSPGAGCSATEGYTFAPDTRMLELRTVAYFIRNNTVGEPALHRLRITVNSDSDLVLTTEELVDGVEDMQVEYGVDDETDPAVAGYGGADKYLPAKDVAADEWDQVVAVRLTLSMRSPQDHVLPTNTSFSYGTGTVNEDKRVRQTFTTTVSLRNRLP